MPEARNAGGVSSSADSEMAPLTRDGRVSAGQASEQADRFQLQKWARENAVGHKIREMRCTKMNQQNEKRNLLYNGTSNLPTATGYIRR